MSDLWLDVRDAWWQLSARPVHTALIVLTLALGIGSNAAVFTIIDHTLLRPVPFAHPDRLVDVIDWNMVRGGGGNNLTPQKILGWQAQTDIFERFEGVSPATMDVTSPGTAARLVGAQVSTGLFSMLGVAPRLGRAFDQQDGRPGMPPVAIISETLWHTRFGADPNVVGRAIVLNDVDVRVVGVMPASFRLYGRYDDFYVPVDVATATTETAGASFYGIARVAAGTSVEAAQARADLIARRLQDANPQPRTWGLRLTRKQVARVDRTMTTILWVLMGAVMCVLLITCVNVANMRLSAMAVRTRETAVRTALGASRGRLMRGALVESLLLSGIGAVAGIAVAWLAVDAAVRFGPSSMAFMQTTHISVDGRVLIYTALVAGVTTLLSGLLPAIRGSRTDLESIMRGSTAGAAATGRGARWSGALIAMQTGLAVVLLVGSALMTRTFINLHAINPGFPLERLTLFELDLPTNRYPDAVNRLTFLDDLRNRIAANPGLEGMAFAKTPVPGAGEFTFGGGGIAIGLESDGIESQDTSRVGWGNVSSSFFEVISLKLIAGRSLMPSDGDDAIVVNESMARHFWPSQPPIGRRIRIGSSGSWMTVVGVVSQAAARMRDLDLPMQMFSNAETWPPASAGPAPTSRASRRSYYPTTVYVRARAGVDAVGVFRAQLASIDPKMAVERVARAETIFDEAFDRQRFTLMVMTAFAMIALIIAMAGVGGVLSYTIATRRREIGIRMALGARGRDVIRVVTGQSALAMTVGMIVGGLGAAALTRTIRSLLYGIDPLDTQSFAMAAAVLATAGMIACIVPAWRALRIEPAVTLRTE